MPDFTVNYATGNTLYVNAVRLSDESANVIALTDNADGTHTGDMPSAGLGQYRCSFYRQLGASPAPTTDTLLYFEMRIWSGSEFDFDKAVDAALGTYKSTGMTFTGLRNGSAEQI